ncbi:putative coiled coil protein [Cryptosporidium felis]|nr:putative coiled coil protein [Cryptosporidium felis]
MVGLEGSSGRKGRLSRFLRPIDSDDEDLENKFGNYLDRGEEKKASVTYGYGENLEVSDSSSRLIGRRGKRKRELGVLGALMNSIKEDRIDYSCSNGENDVNKFINTNKTSSATERKKNDSEFVDISRLLNSLDKVKSDNRLDSQTTKGDISSIFDSFSVPGSNSDNEGSKRPNEFIPDSMSSSSEDEYLNLTEMEKAIRKSVKNDYNPTLELNEWLPTQIFDLKSEVIDIAEGNEGVISEKHEFFYRQWIEQYGYLSFLTKDFTRNVVDSFIKDGQIPPISEIKEKKPELLLDPDDEILISVQNFDGCVILNRLINIANSQQKLIIEMNKEIEGSKDVDENATRLKFGVISVRARRKLWWICRVAEHCGFFGREVKSIIRYCMLERDNSNSSTIFSDVAITSSIEPATQLFSRDEPEVSKSGTLDSDEDGRDTSEVSEIDSKWSELSSIKVSDKARPWEKGSDRTDLRIKKAITPKRSDENSKIQQFKFMLKNIGPRPTWTSKSTFKDVNGEEELQIEILPPPNLSLREQGQIKIKWLQMKDQAEKLAIHHFKIIDPETKTLDHEKLKYWCEIFKINLILPSKEIPIKRRVKIHENSSNITETENVEEWTLESLPENLRMNESSEYDYAASGRSNTLKLDVEYVSEVSESEKGSFKSEYELDNFEEAKHVPESESYDERVSSEDIGNLPTNKNTFGNKIEKGSEDNDGSEAEEEEFESSELRKEVYRRLKAVRKKRKKLKKRMMEKYGHLFEDEAEESEDDGVRALRRGIGGEEDEDVDDDLEWDELSGFSDFIDDKHYEDEELNGDAIQAHIKHMKQIEDKQYRLLFTLEGIKERKSKIFGLDETHDDGISGETRLEKKKNEMFNSAFFDDDVISEFWTDDEQYEDLDEEIDERNLTEMLGLDFEEWKSSLPTQMKSSDESLNEQRRVKHKLLKDSLLKEASSSINLLKHRFHSFEAKLSSATNMSDDEKRELEKKYLENVERLKRLLRSIHSACDKCIYENSQFFDHIDIGEYIEKRQESKQPKQSKTNSRESKFRRKRWKGKFSKEKVDLTDKSEVSLSDSENETFTNNKSQKMRKDVVNIKGGRFIISKDGGETLRVSKNSN